MYCFPRFVERLDILVFLSVFYFPVCSLCAMAEWTGNVMWLVQMAAYCIKLIVMLPCFVGQLLFSHEDVVAVILLCAGRCIRAAFI